MNKTRLKKYAELIAKCGANVQKKQDVLITAELDQPEFVEMLVKECYKAGAKRVFVDWTHQPLSAINTKYCTASVLGSLEEWQIKKWEWQADTLPAKIPTDLQALTRKSTRRQPQSAPRQSSP